MTARDSQTSFHQAHHFLTPVLTKGQPSGVAEGSSLLKQLYGSLHGTKRDESREGRRATAAANTALNDDDDIREAVILKALDLLHGLYKACGTRQASSSPPNPQADSHNPLYNTKNIRTLYGLLDLLVLEGIYPFLSPGVGVPIERRVQTLLQAGFISQRNMAEAPGAADAKKTDSQDLGLLRKVSAGMVQLVSDSETGINRFVRDRVLVDVVAACAELAYSPRSLEGNKDTRQAFQSYLKKDLVDKTSTSSAMAVLTSLLHSAAPAWLRVQISGLLALLPLRADGVRSTIEFIASATPSARPLFVPPPPAERGAARRGEHGPGARAGVRAGVGAGTSAGAGAGTGASEPEVKKTHSVHLPLEALERSARLLASVPRALSPDVYYGRIAPQLFDLLDDEAGDDDDGSGSSSSSKGLAGVAAGGFSDMARVGAFIIGRIITAAANKKGTGADAPAQAGWAVFAEPLLATLDPSRSPQRGALTAASRRQPRTTDATAAAAAAAAAEVEMGVVLVTGDELRVALSRLVKLACSHPNPTLVRQLVTPILLPLWALMCFSRPGGRLERKRQQWEQQQQQQQEVQQDAHSLLNNDGAYRHQSSALLHTYFRVAAGADELARIKANLLYDGGSDSSDGSGSSGGAPSSSPASAETKRRETGGGWVFALGPTGGVEVQLRPARGVKEEEAGEEEKEVKEERASRSALFNQLLASCDDLDTAQRESLFIRAV